MRDLLQLTIQFNPETGNLNIIPSPGIMTDEVIPVLKAALDVACNLVLQGAKNRGGIIQAPANFRPSLLSAIFRPTTASYCRTGR